MYSLKRQIIYLQLNIEVFGYIHCMRMCLFLKWHVANLCTKGSRSSIFLKESMSMVSFQIWRIIVIELHKQPAEEVRFPVTSRRFSLKTKRVEKGIVIAAPWHIGTKAQPEWFIFLPALKREMLSPHCLCLSCAGGVPGEGSAMQDSRLWSTCPHI